MPACIDVDALVPAATQPPDALARDEGYWAGIAALYDVTDEVIHLENGYWGAMARPVQAAYLRHIEAVNHGNAWYGRVAYPAQLDAARARAARMLGVGEDEIAFTRGASEALQTLIGGYNRLAPGDDVLYADVDYDGMIDAMRWLRQRRGVQVHRLALPATPTHAQLLQAYADAFVRLPRLKLVLLTQVCHRHGLVLPVAELTAMARARGIDAIIDAAHGIGQLGDHVPDLGADFVGINLHKWVGAPVGVGALYIRRGRLADVDPYMGAADDGSVHSRVHAGTANFAAYLALPDAIALHQRIGVANKRARLLHLRDRWTAAAATMPHIALLASPDPRLSSALAAFRLRERPSLEDTLAVQRTLLQRHGIFTTVREGLASGAWVRVTPSIFTSPAQMDALVRALRALV